MLKKIFITISSLIIFACTGFAFDMSQETVGISPFGATPEMQQYSLAVGKKIISNFDMPQTNASLATLVLFKVDKTGKLVEYKIVQSSGSTDFDNRVLNAVKKSSPYPEPNFDEPTDVGVLLNMDLNIIKLIKMLSDLDTNLMDFNMDLEQLIPQEYQTQPTTVPGKKFVNPYEL